MLELNKIYNMDCIEGMKQIESNSIDSIVTDPPYGLGFMGKEWDTYDKTQFGRKGNEGENDLKNKKNFNVLPRYRSDNSFYDFSLAWAKEAYRVLKPGGYLLSFGGTRTYHRMACAIEDAGFEIRDMITWTYGSGFPKSLNVGKAIDKLQGNERKLVGTGKTGIGEERSLYRNSLIGEYKITKDTSEWEGWGTALKPACEKITMAQKPFNTIPLNNISSYVKKPNSQINQESICMARKPLAEKSVAENVLKYGTGGINIDESRVGTEIQKNNFNDFSNQHGNKFGNGEEIKKLGETETTGRFPANFIHDGSPEVLKEFEKAGVSSPGHWANTKVTGFGAFGNGKSEYFGVGRKCEAGTTARFFKSCEFELEDAPSFIYQAKASKSERNDGLDCNEFYTLEIVLNNDANSNILWKDKITIPEDLEVKLLGDMEVSVKKVIDESGINWKADLDLNIISFGKLILEQYLTDIKYTTKMEINSITSQQILNWLHHYTISEHTQDVFSKMMDGGRIVVNVESNNTLTIFIKEPVESALGVNPVVLRMQLIIKKEKNSNIHPTIKPLKLMEYLVKLVTPKDGVCLDPFMGSGTTAVACKKNGFKYLGFEKEAEYIEICEARLKNKKGQERLF